MVAKLRDNASKQTAENVWYYENIEGGHACAADNKQRAFMKTLEYMFLWNNLQSMSNADAAQWRLLTNHKQGQPMEI